MKKIMVFRFLLLALLSLFFIACLAQASPDVFRWTDEQGRTHFTDDINKVPQRFRREAEEKKDKDIPPLVPLEDLFETKGDESPEVLKRDEREQVFREIEPRLNRDFDPGPPGIGYEGQQIDSQRLKIVNGGVKHIPELGVGYSFTFLNPTKDPIWIALKIGKQLLVQEGIAIEKGVGCNAGHKIDPDELFTFLCRVDAGLIDVTHDYQVEIEVFDNERAWKLPHMPGLKNEPVETHRFEFRFKYGDIKKIKDLHPQREEYLGEHTHHEEIQSDWIEIVSSGFRVYNIPESYSFGLTLKNKTRKTVWMTVSFEDSQNNEICTVVDKIEPWGEGSFGCRQEGVRVIGAEYKVNLVVYRKEKNARKGEFPKETLQTILRSR